jgi:hypothetical protein
MALADTFDMPLRYYVGHWLGCLAHCDYPAQEASLYAFRAVGAECYTRGYGEDMRYEVSHGGVTVIINPDHKDPPNQ